MNVRNLSDVLSSAIAAQERGERGVIITVVANRGGTPLPPGARLFVPEPGTVQGNLHPALDEMLLADALASIKDRRSGMRSYRLSNGHAERAALQSGDIDVFFEVINRRPRLVIVGGGHIAQPLARIGAVLDLEVIVLDDRPEYANAQRFPVADQILVGPYREALERVPVDSDTYIVLVTRGHVHDRACLEQVLGSPAPYIGMIGSKRRVRTVMRHIEERGLGVVALERVHAPIGLDIGAETPAEIAVSIAAELIKVRRGGSGTSLTLRAKRRV